MISLTTCPYRYEAWYPNEPASCFTYINTIVGGNYMFHLSFSTKYTELENKLGLEGLSYEASLFGKGSKNLILESHSKYWGYYYNWELDQEGYPSKVRIVELEEYNGIPSDHPYSLKDTSYYEFKYYSE